MERIEVKPVKALEFLDISKFEKHNNIVITKECTEKAIDIAFKEGQQNPKVKKLEWTKEDYGYKTRTRLIDFIIYDDECGITIKSSNCTLHKDMNSVQEAMDKAQEHFEELIIEYILQ